MTLLLSLRKLTELRLAASLMIVFCMICAARNSSAFTLPCDVKNKTEVTIAGMEVEEEENMIDTTQEEASELLLDAAEWFDSFFDDIRTAAEENKTQAKLRLETRYHEKDDFDFRSSVRWRIDLPRLEKKVNLILFAAEDQDEDVERTLDNKNISRSGNNTSSTLAAALQYFIKTTDTLNLSTSAGASTDYVFAGIRFRKSFDYNSWQGRFINRLRYYSDDGWQNYTSFDLERHISDNWFFRNTAAVIWEEDDDDNFAHSLTFQLYQFLSDCRAISYEIVNEFDTDPSHKLTDTTFRLRYRQQFYREWLMLEVAPQVNFPEEYDRDAQLGIRFVLEAKFGYKETRKLRNIFRF